MVLLEYMLVFKTGCLGLHVLLILLEETEAKGIAGELIAGIKLAISAQLHCMR